MITSKYPRAKSGERNALRPSAPAVSDTGTDALLAFLAVAPLAINLVVQSPAAARYLPLTPSQLERLTNAAPYLEGAGALALAALTFRQKNRGSDGRALKAAAALTTATKVLDQALPQLVERWGDGQARAARRSPARRRV